MKVTTKRTYYGWVVVEDPGDKALADVIWVEWTDNGNGRQRKQMGYGESGCVTAVEWWDKKVGQPVMLQPTLKGCYRVYTEIKEAANGTVSVND